MWNNCSETVRDQQVSTHVHVYSTVSGLAHKTYSTPSVNILSKNILSKSQAKTKASSYYLSLYLMTASTIFFIFLVRTGGLGESFSAGGRPLFLCLFPSSSLSPRPRPPEEEEGPGRSRSRSLFLLRVVFLCRTSSSISSRVPSSIACVE